MNDQVGFDGPGPVLDLAPVEAEIATAHSPGVRIGLSLVAAFTALHAGRAWVEDAPDPGAASRIRVRPKRVSRIQTPSGDEVVTWLIVRPGIVAHRSQQMAEVVLYHHALGLAEGVRAIADGVIFAQRLAQTRSGAEGALLMQRVLDFLGRCS